MDEEIQRSKVPEVTLVFWIIKILATTLGETGGDAVSMSMNLGYAVSSLIFIGTFVVAVIAQIAAKKFHPFLYWLVVIATTTAGTTMADFADRSLGVGYPGGATLLFVLLMASLAVWYWSAGSVSVNTVSTPRIETFYWVAILFSQTLGTALGDWMADTNDLGYQGGALVFAAGLALIAAAYFFTTISRTLLFWGAFILTRPLGATLGDLLDKPWQRRPRIQQVLCVGDPGRRHHRVRGFPAAARGRAPRQTPTDRHLVNRERTRMQPIHLPTLGARYWSALCLASIFGANMGDLFARNLGLGHVAGLPFLAVALAIVIVAERFDRIQHEIYYWIAIIIVRTAATNFADFAAGDLKLPRVWVMAGLTVLLVAALWLTWQFAWRRHANKTDNVLRADLGYWTCMFIAGTLGTVIGDFCSHNLRLDDAGAAIALSPIVVVLLLVGWRGALRLLPFYWLTVVAIRAAGTAVGDLVSGRNMLGLPMSTAVTGILFVVLLWKESGTSQRPAVANS